VRRTNDTDGERNSDEVIKVRVETDAPRGGAFGRNLDTDRTVRTSVSVRIIRAGRGVLRLLEVVKNAKRFLPCAHRPRVDQRREKLRSPERFHGAREEYRLSVSFASYTGALNNETLRGAWLLLKISRR